MKQDADFRNELVFSSIVRIVEVDLQRRAVGEFSGAGGEPFTVEPTVGIRESGIRTAMRQDRVLAFGNCLHFELTFGRETVVHGDAAIESNLFGRGYFWIIVADAEDLGFGIE